MWDMDIHASEFDLDLLKSNIINASTLEELQTRERIITKEKSLIFAESKKDFSLTYNHLKSIHEFLFKEIYSWAGQDRYDMQLYGDFKKSESSFCRGIDIKHKSKEIFDASFNIKSENDFIKVATKLMNDLNYLHPFREGNGRVTRLFIEQFARSNNLDMKLGNISKEKMIQASISGLSGDKTALFHLIRQNTKELGLSR